jgi:hypothetical protein
VVTLADAAPPPATAATRLSADKASVLVSHENPALAVAFWENQPEDDGLDGESAHARGRAAAWVVVGLIVAATCAAGVGLIVSQPWLFWTGVGAAVLATVFGRITHAMRGVTVPKYVASPAATPSTS